MQSKCKTKIYTSSGRCYHQNDKITNKEGTVNLMYIFNAKLRLEHWPKSLNIAQIIMILKSGKNLMDISSYLPT